ncbi:MAG: hypothetical protein R2831_02015 [Chitinophagaceae bacterium]
MKTILLTVLFFSTCIIAQATILRVNNNPLVSNTFTTAQDAHDAANPGDTIHLEPTILGSYGSLTVTKKIVLIGTGDFLTENPNLQANSSPGSCDLLTLESGSEYSVISAKINNYIQVKASHISITQSSCGGIELGDYGLGINDISITRSFTSSIYTIDSCQNVIILNNIISDYLSINSVSDGILISHNTFSNYYVTIDIFNSNFSSNIFCYGIYTFQVFNSILSNNITSDYNLPSGNNNLNGVDMSTVFLNYGFFLLDNYQLNPSYPNQNLGAYAGTMPYKAGCQPSVPAIYHLSMPASTVGNSMNITVSTKSNN